MARKASAIPSPDRLYHGRDAVAHALQRTVSAAKHGQRAQEIACQDLLNPLVTVAAIEQVLDQPR
jgi:hypothetical protein